MDEDFRLFRLTSKELSPDSTNLVDQIVYNQDNLVIKSWSSGIIITSAIFHPVRLELSRWKKSYDRIKAENTQSSDVRYDICPAAFLWPLAWNDVLQLSINPHVGPVLSSALKELSSIRKTAISLRIISCLINYNFFIIPYDPSFLKEGLTNYLHLFNIDQVTILQLADKVCTSASFDPLITFLKNYKLKMEKS